MALTQQQVDAYNAGRIFDANKLQELQRLGATRVQMAAIASKAAIITDEVAKALPEIATPNFMKGSADVSKVPAEFDWIKYLNANPELDALGIDTQFEAKFHYAQTGNKESKPSAPSKTAESSYTPPPLVEGRVESFKTIREELVNQYNSLVKLSPSVAYKGDVEDLERTIFADQARFLREAGVRTISDLTIEDGKLINKATGLPVTTTNLGGQVVRDERTGVLKWGDTSAGVKGSANYGVQTLPDGSLAFLPVYKPTASPLAQVGLDFLEPLAVFAGTVFGTVIGGPAGAGIGNSIGQLLATGDLDLEKALAAAAIVWAGSEISEISSATAGSAGAGAGGGSGISAGAGGGSGISAGAGGGSGISAGTASTSIGGGAIGTGLTAPAGFTLAPGLGTSLAAGGAGGLLAADAAFAGADAAQLYAQTGNVAAVQQNLIAAGIDPIMAAEAANLAAYGGTGASIGSALASTFPGETVFTSQGLLSGGSTLDPFAKDIAGITSTADSGIGLTDALRAANSINSLLNPPKIQQQTGLPQAQSVGGGQARGVDFSPLYQNSMVGLLPLAERYRRSLL